MLAASVPREFMGNFFFPFNKWKDKSPGYLTLWRRRSLSYRNQSIDLQSKSVDWFLYDTDLRHERVKEQLLKKIFRKHHAHLVARGMVKINNKVGGTLSETI